MPDLVAAYAADPTLTDVAANFGKHRASQSGVGTEKIVKIAKSNMTDADLKEIIANVTVPGGTDGSLTGNLSDAHTIGGICASSNAGVSWGDFVSGASDIVMMRVQGTGVLNVTGAAGATTATVTIEAVFAPLT